MDTIMRLLASIRKHEKVQMISSVREKLDKDRHIIYCLSLSIKEDVGTIILS